MTDISKSIEELEQDFWAEPDFPSYVVRACHAARKKPVQSLSAEELRCLIGQRIGLKYILSAAVSLLEHEPMTETALFPGDLLLAVLRLDAPDWAENPDALRAFAAMLRENRAELGGCAEIPQKLLEKYISTPNDV